MVWPAYAWTPFVPAMDPRLATPYSPPQWGLAPDPFQQPPPVNSPITHATRSGKYPNLNPALAEDTASVRFDIKFHPGQTIVPQVYQTLRSQYAMAAPQKHIMLVSKHFPWTIHIGGSQVTHNLTCDDVWAGIWTALQINIVDSEWGFIVKDKGMLETVENSIKKRVAMDPRADRHPKRIDLLGDMTMFRGLEKDDAFVKQRLLPGSARCDQIWSIKLTT